MKVKLGKKYTDKISGIAGIATAICQYLTGCTQVCLESVNRDKTEIKEYWFDVTRIEGVKLVKVSRKPGGPGPHPPSTLED